MKTLSSSQPLSPVFSGSHCLQDQSPNPFVPEIQGLHRMAPGSLINSVFTALHCELSSPVKLVCTLFLSQDTQSPGLRGQLLSRWLLQLPMRWPQIPSTWVPLASIKNSPSSKHYVNFKALLWGQSPWEEFLTIQIHSDLFLPCPFMIFSFSSTMKAATGCHWMMPQVPGKEISLSCSASVSRAFLSGLLPSCPSQHCPAISASLWTGLHLLISPHFFRKPDYPEAAPNPSVKSHFLTSSPKDDRMGKYWL